MAEAVSKAGTFSINQDAKIAALLEGAPPIVKTRIAGLQEERKTAIGRSLARDQEVADAVRERDELQIAVRSLERAEKRSGLILATDRTIQDEQGNLQTERTRSPELATRKTRIGVLEKIIRDERERSFPFIIGNVLNTIGRLPADFKFVPEDFELPMPKNPPEREYQVQFAKMRHLEKEIDATFERPRTLAEMRDGIVAEVAALAAKGRPRTGGFRRGFDNVANEKTVATSPQIGWPIHELYRHDGIQAQIDTVDTASLFAWLYRDELTAALIADLESEYTDEGAMTADDKTAKIAQLRRDLWLQRHVVEATFCNARDAGSKLLRPPYTPVAVLLGCMPF